MPSMTSQVVAPRARKRRKYLNAVERLRFIRATEKLDEADRLFCLMLAFTGCRPSEALALSAGSFDLDQGIVMIETLKRRGQVERELLLPPSLLAALDRCFALRARQTDAATADARLWAMRRETAWRKVKLVMASAGVPDDAAMPKGLRHGFAVAAFLANVPPHVVQKWLDHASMRTTAIYGDVIGTEERAFASRLWQDA